MATLFSRIIGSDTGEVRDEQGALISGGKIPLHIFTALLHEFADEVVTGAQVKAVLKLDADETKDAKYLYDLIVAAPNKSAIQRIIKDQLYLGEWPGTAQYYSDEAAFWARVEAVITDAGGTLPVRG